MLEGLGTIGGLSPVGPGGFGEGSLSSHGSTPSPSQAPEIGQGAPLDAATSGGHR